MKRSHPLYLLALAALALLLLPQVAVADDLPNMTPVRCAEDGMVPAGLQGGQILGDLEPEPEQKIQNGPCSFCTENSSCSTECDDNGTPSTCGDYGVCDACREALVEIHRELIGQDAEETFWGICEYQWHYEVTYQSVNSSSCPTYTYCEMERDTENTWDVDVWCCDTMSGGCWGETCS